MYKILAKSFFVGKRTVFMPSCHSTSEVASDLLKKGPIEDGTLIITDNQTKGRGQQGNSWESRPGQNLTFSIVLKPHALTINDHFQLNIISSLAIKSYLNTVCHLKVFVKWPNDIYVGTEKIAGILISNILRSNYIVNSIIGIGLNINQTDFNVLNATSLKLCSGVGYSLPESLELLVLEIEKYYFKWKRGEINDLVKEYQDSLYWKDVVHTFLVDNNYFTGIIRGINNAGQLHIERENDHAFFNFKEVSFIE